MRTTYSQKNGSGSAYFLRGIAICLTLASTHAAAQSIRVTEYAYKAVGGEFIEFTNVGPTSTNLAGWSIDDEESIPGSFDLSAAGVIAPGESFVVTTVPAAAFRATWSLGASPVKVLGDNDTAKLSRTDSIVLFSPTFTEVDRLDFSDVNFEYTVRARDISAWVCSSALGQNDAYGWRQSALGDAQGSTVSAAADVGSPGTHTSVICDPLVIGANYCAGRPNSTGFVGVMSARGHPVVSQNVFSLQVIDLPPNVTGLAIMGQSQTLAPMAGGSQGTLCVGPGLTRLNSLVRSATPSGAWTADLDISHPMAQGLPAVLGGETWYFQLWYRDSNPSPTSNFSTGWTVNFH